MCHWQIDGGMHVQFSVLYILLQSRLKHKTSHIGLLDNYN